MKLDFKKAFNSPFSDEKWYIKMIFPFILAILGIISSTFYKNDQATNAVINLVTLIPSIILGGFYAQFAHNEIYDKSPLLPDLESGVKDFLKYGFKLLGVMIVYFSIVIIGAILGFTGLNNPNILSILGTILLLIGIPICFVLAILAEGIFFDTFCFKDTLDYKKVIKLLSKVKMEVGVYFLLCICFMILTSICNSIVELLGFAIIFAAAFITIVQFIMVNISAQIYKIAKARLG